MNTSAILTRTKQTLSQLGTACRRFPRDIFGNISYQPPGWLASLLGRWRAFERKHSRLLGIALIGLADEGVGSAAGKIGWFTGLRLGVEEACEVFTGYVLGRAEILIGQEVRKQRRLAWLTHDDGAFSLQVAD